MLGDLPAQQGQPAASVVEELVQAQDYACVAVALQLRMQTLQAGIGCDATDAVEDEVQLPVAAAATPVLRGCRRLRMQLHRRQV